VLSGSPFAAATLGGHGFFHQFHGLGHLFDVSGVQAEVLVDAGLDQAHGLTDLVGRTAQGLGIDGISALGALQQAEQPDGHQAGVVEVVALDAVQQAGDRCGGTLAAVAQPAFDLIEATARGQLAGAQVNWADDHALSIVMATKGYPGNYAKGSVINGLDHLPETSKSMCFHAGTTQTETAITATGGRVLNITARAESLRAAREAAYSAAEQVDWPEGFFRTDIGWRAL